MGILQNLGQLWDQPKLDKLAGQYYQQSQDDPSGRTGLAYTWQGKLNLRNAKYQKDDTPLDINTNIRNLNLYSKSYINHLINTNEILASMILTINNIAFYQELMAKIREAIKNNTFDDFYDKYFNVI